MPTTREPPRARDEPHRRQRPFGRRQRHIVAERGADLIRQVRADQDSRWSVASPRECGQRPVLDAAREIRHAPLERRIDALEGDERVAASGSEQRLAEDRRRHAGHPRDPPQPRRLGVVVGDAALLPDIHVCARPENPIPQLALQPGHERQRNDERRDPDRDPEHRDQRDERDERLLPLRKQVAPGDVEFEGQGDAHGVRLRAPGSRLRGSSRLPPVSGRYGCCKFHPA